MDENKVREIVTQMLNDNALMGKTAFQVPLHRHNGSDSPKIIMGDLAYDERGLSFPSVQGDVGFTVYNDLLNQHAIFQLRPTGVNPLHRLIMFGFESIGIYAEQDGFVFNSSGGGSSSDVPRAGILADPSHTLLYVYNALTDYTTYDYLPESLNISRSGASWFLRMPVCASLPASPQVGDICFYGTQLQVCESAGFWTAK